MPVAETGVLRGLTYRVFIPGMGSQTVDFAIRSVRMTSQTRRVLPSSRDAFSHLSIARKWCTLDASGEAKLETAALPPQSISVVRVRSQQGDWLPAVGTSKWSGRIASERRGQAYRVRGTDRD